ncbi:MAG: exodeoxyribonuclease VII large subunit [Elusimicrobiota bacterium]|jgi:exodeoxyribonuclease VII large subunit|nr:exodeoxyribonuclease VII large subunit [Elusimicrobiota bacterium]
MEQEQELYFDSGGRLVYTVSQINNEIKEVLEGSYPAVWIEGEISNFKSYNSGHFYFYLKDEKSQIKAVMFSFANNSLSFEPQDGMKVLVFGRISAYPARGEYQIIVSRIEQIGIGDLAKKFEQLKKQLEHEGLFDDAHKKPIPSLINRIGIVTSQDGAALRDILTVLDSLGAEVEVLIYPSRVQGGEAQKEIPQAIRYLNAHHKELDILLVGRGGGSIEDLWAFNTEPVARAIFDSQIPIISCIGHETDFTIADFAADLRAPTPSAAAEMAVRNKLEIVKNLQYAKENLIDSINDIYDDNFQQVKNFALSRAFVSPHLIYEDKISYVVQLDDDLKLIMDKFLSAKQEKLSVMSHQLDLVSPLSVLKRGYAVCSADDGSILKDTSAISVGDNITVRLAKGNFKASVSSLQS